MITDINQLDLTKSYNYAQYLTWNLTEMVELIRGKIIKMSPAPANRHQMVSSNLHITIGVFLKGKSCKIYSAPFDVRLTRSYNDQEVTTVVQPDLCVICDPLKLDERGCNGAPDFIIEILSPQTARKDARDKFDLYEEAGVKEYWLVEPLEKLVDVFLLKDGKYQFIKKYVEDDLVQVNTFPDLVISLKEIFE